MERAQAGVWAWVVAATGLVALATLQLTAYEPTLGTRTALPIWVVAIAIFGAQSLPIHITTAGGRHSVVLTEVVLAVGLFMVEPSTLVLGMVAGSAPALLKVRPSPAKLAVNLTQAGLWSALPAWLFHATVDVVEPVPVDIGVAFLACVVAFLGATVSVRVPIGLATGEWGVGSAEGRYLLASGVTGLGAAALALVGVVLADVSAGLLALLVLPVGQIVMATIQQARAVDRRSALDFTVVAAQQLREADDVRGVLVSLLPGLRTAFAVDEVVLLLDVPGQEAAATVTAQGTVESVVVGDALRRWLRLRAGDGPSSLRRDPSLVELAELLEARELLMAPVPVSRGMGAIMLIGRPLGDFRGDHIELMRTWVAAAASALERQLIAIDLDEAQSRGAELERRASHDPLTSLANRALFERELDAAVRAGQPCSVLFIDLDGFKAVNDTWGHAAGDAVLVAAAERIMARVRGTDVAARLGGDEFAILVRDRRAADAVTIGERVLADFAEPVEDAPGVRQIRAAIGVAETRPGDDSASLLQRADEAMYVAKRSGGHRVEVTA